MLNKMVQNPTQSGKSRYAGKNLYFTFVFSLLFISIAQSQGAIDELFNRNWNRTMSYGTLTFIFKSDSTCTFNNPANNFSVTAKIQLEGNTITFPAEGCPIEGIYKFEIIENSLTFLAENDACKERKDAVEGTWTATVETASAISPKTLANKKILMDIAHGQKFWNDPADMVSGAGNDPSRVKYLTDQLVKTASSVGAELFYLKNEIKPENLSDCDLLFIHIPSKKYSPGEVEAIRQYLENGGSLFLVMEVDYWSTLDDANVNDIIKPFDMQFGGQTPDTLSGGYTMTNLITTKPLKITYHAGRSIKGGTPFCYNGQSEEYPFGVYKSLEGGGKLIAMGDGMVSLYMTSWQGVNDYQCSEFMHDTFKWLLTEE